MSAMTWVLGAILTFRHILTSKPCYILPITCNYKKLTCNVLINFVDLEGKEEEETKKKKKKKMIGDKDRL